MTTRRSSANHRVNVSLGLISGASVGSDSAMDLGSTNLKAAFPVRESGSVLMACLVLDYGAKVSLPSAAAWAQGTRT
jgi:hypothetical protein